MTALSRASGNSLAGRAHSSARMQPVVRPPSAREESFIPPTGSARQRSEKGSELQGEGTSIAAVSEGGDSGVSELLKPRGDSEKSPTPQEYPSAPDEDSWGSKAVTKRPDTVGSKAQPDFLSEEKGVPDKAEDRADNRENTPSPGNIPPASPITVSSMQTIEHRSRLSRIAVALSPAFSVLFILAGVSGFLVSSPRRLISHYPSLFETALHLPPSELQIQKPELRPFLLDNGESVYLVTGRVINRSSDTFSQIQVQALTFDDQGRTLQSARASAGGVFSAARLSSFSADENLELQRESLTETILSDSTKAADFQIVLPQQLVSRSTAPATQQEGVPTFFSVRVYGVNKSP